MKHRFLITLIEIVEVTETITFLIEKHPQKGEKQPTAESGAEVTDADGNISWEVVTTNTSQIDSKNDPSKST